MRGRFKSTTVNTVLDRVSDTFTPSHYSGAGIMEADDRQVTTIFTVQPSFTNVGEPRGEV